MSDVAAITEALARLRAEGGDGNLLVLSQGEGFLVFSGQRGGRYLRCEAATSKLVGRRLALDRVSLLREAGFDAVAESACLTRGFEVGAGDAPEDVAALALRLLAGVYEPAAGVPVELSVRLGDRERAVNPGVVEAMRTVAKTRDMTARSALYRQLLRSSLLVPMNEEGPRVVGELSGWSVFAAFTSWEALRRWDPRVGPFQVIKGRALFPLLVQRQVGSLLLDPAGRVGGELYRNEVESVAGAVR